MPLSFTMFRTTRRWAACRPDPSRGLRRRCRNSMLFNSYAFLLGFFPVTFFVFFFLGRRNRESAAMWLGLASLFFYGYWSIAALSLLIVSVCFNYWVGPRGTPA